MRINHDVFAGPTGGLGIAEPDWYGVAPLALINWFAPIHSPSCSSCQNYPLHRIRFTEYACQGRAIPKKSTFDGPRYRL